MTQQLSTTLSTTHAESWDAALEDAEKEFHRASVKAERWKGTVAIIKAKIASGEPWPGTQSDDHKSEAATQC